MRPLTILAGLCLSLLGFSQSTYVSPLANPLPAGKVLVVGKDFTVAGKPVYLRGTNITYLGCFPPDPVAAANWLRDRGFNWVRLHHVDVLLRNGTKEVSDLLKFVDALYSVGIRVSIDGISQYQGYSKLSLYNGLNRADYEAYVRKLAPILKHPGCFLFTLINEGYTEVKNSSASSNVDGFYQWGKKLVNSINPDLIVGDGGDMNIDPLLFGPIAAHQDVILNHIYGTHPQNGKYRYESWAENGHFAGVSFWLNSLAQDPAPVADALMTGRPSLFQEFGCLPFAADRAINEVYLASEAKKRMQGLCSFQAFSNVAQWRFETTQVDDYSIFTDYARTVADFAGSLIAKYAGTEIEYYSGHPIGKRDPNYRRVTEKVKVFLTRDRGTVICKVSSKKYYVVTLDAVLIRGYVSSTALDGWITTTNRGGSDWGFYGGKSIDLGAPISGVYRLNPWTLAQESTLVKKGNAFVPDRGCAVYVVNML
jgi:hypothetical protein